MNIINESDTTEFIRRLPDLTAVPPTSALLMLAVRSRKARLFQNINPKDMLVERKVIRPIKEWRNKMFDAVYNFSLMQRHGRFSFWDVNKVKNVLITGYAMCVLSTIAPRHATAAMKQTIQTSIHNLDSVDPITRSQNASMDAAYLSALHGMPVGHKLGGGPFVTIDIDTDETALFELARDIVSPIKKWAITEVSRGKHIILDLRNDSDAEAFYHEATGIQKMLRTKTDPKEVEIIKDNTEPVAGTMYAREANQEWYVRILE